MKVGVWVVMGASWLALMSGAVSAQEARTGNGPVVMKAGSVEFVQQGTLFDVQLDGISVDRLSARRIAHFDEPTGARMVVEAFEAGAPEVFVYDFRKRPPVVEKVERRMVLSGVFWQGDEIVMRASDGWYRFQRGTVTRLSSSKTVFH